MLWSASKQSPWGAVGVLGSCTKIKSELLSGELDVVYMLSVSVEYMDDKQTA